MCFGFPNIDIWPRQDNSMENWMCVYKHTYAHVCIFTHYTHMFQNFAHHGSTAEVPQHVLTWGLPASWELCSCCCMEYRLGNTGLLNMNDTQASRMVITLTSIWQTFQSNILSLSRAVHSNLTLKSIPSLCTRKHQSLSVPLKVACNHCKHNYMLFLPCLE